MGQGCRAVTAEVMAVNPTMNKRAGHRLKTYGRSFLYLLMVWLGLQEGA